MKIDEHCLDDLTYPICLGCVKQLDPDRSSLIFTREGPMDGPAQLRAEAGLCEFVNGVACSEKCTKCGGGTIAGVYLR